MKQTEHK